MKPGRLLKEWLPIALSTVAVVVSVAAWWENQVSARPRLHLEAQAMPESGCSEIDLDVTNQSSRAITLAPPFLADLRPRPKPKTLRERLLAPLPLVVSLRPSVHRSEMGPIFLQPQEAVEFTHKLTPGERRLLRRDSRLVVAVTDYVGHFWSSSIPSAGLSGGLDVLRYPCD